LTHAYLFLICFWKKEGEKMSLQLIPGKTTRIDVGGQKPLFLTMTTRHQEPQQLPVVKVESTHGGFGCKVRSIILCEVPAGVDEALQTVDTYAITLECRPGTDLSGADVAVTDPATGKTARAEVFMCS
jgi:hypothetical protein